MEIGQRLGITEPLDLGYEAFEELQHAVSAVDEAAKEFVRIDAGLLATFIEPALRA